jgi:hypothetical protein
VELKGTGMAELGSAGTMELEGTRTGAAADGEAGVADATGDPGLPMQYG